MKSGPMDSGCNYAVSVILYLDDEITYGMMVSCAPGSVARLGKGEAHACSTSANVFVAGKLYHHQSISGYNEREDAYVAGFPEAGTALGMTAEQSINFSGLLPITANLAMTLLKELDISSCSLMKLCHVQAVRGSRARRKSDWRRNSPGAPGALNGRGDRASPRI